MACSDDQNKLDRVKSETSMESVAVVAVPFPAQGHLNGMLHLSLQLASRGLPVHYAAHARHARAHGWGEDALRRVGFDKLDVPAAYASPPPPPPDRPRPRRSRPTSSPWPRPSPRARAPGSPGCSGGSPRAPAAWSSLLGINTPWSVFHGTASRHAHVGVFPACESVGVSRCVVSRLRRVVMCGLLGIRSSSGPVG
jgi:hypothetical protein